MVVAQERRIENRIDCAYAVEYREVVMQPPDALQHLRVEQCRIGRGVGQNQELIATEPGSDLAVLLQGWIDFHHQRVGRRVKGEAGDVDARYDTHACNQREHPSGLRQYRGVNLCKWPGHSLPSIA